MDRIGSPKAGGVPAKIIVDIDGKTYHITPLGKFDVVGALIISDEKKYSIRLFPEDLDILATILHQSGTTPSQGLTLQVLHPKRLEYVSRTLAVNSPAERLLRKFVMLFHLPEYQVQPGDTVSKIVTQHFHNTVTVEDVVAVNPGLNPDYIEQMVLKIPANAVPVSEMPSEQ